MMKDYCFIGDKFDPTVDFKLFEDDDMLVQIKPKWSTLAHLMADIQAFASASEAKRNGWNVPIPVGWSEHKLPKKFFGAKMYIWNPDCTLAEFETKE